jgi:cell division protein FtsB
MPLSCILATVAVVALLALCVWLYRQYDLSVIDYDLLVDDYNDLCDSLDANRNLRTRLEAECEALKETVQRLEAEETRLKSDRDKSDTYAKNLLNRLHECQNNLADKTAFISRNPPAATTEMGQILDEVRKEKNAECRLPEAPKGRLVPEDFKPVFTPRSGHTIPSEDAAACQSAVRAVNDVAATLNSSPPQTYREIATAQDYGA